MIPVLFKYPVSVVAYAAIDLEHAVRDPAIPDQRRGATRQGGHGLMERQLRLANVSLPASRSVEPDGESSRMGGMDRPLSVC